MGKGLPRLSRSNHPRVLHTHTPPRQRQRRNDFWSPTTKIKTGVVPENTTAHLVDAGFIKQSNAGVYHFLPLGLRVLGKLENLLDKHMTAVGASKVALSALSNQSLWRKSGRLDAGGELFKFTDRSKTNWLLAPTHEEEITEVVRQSGWVGQSNAPSLRLYQIGRKYRDEIRPRGGLLRGKEFIMKDLYTFDSLPEQARTTYDQIRATYRRFFDELGLAYIEARADSGSMGGNLSHEYHFPNHQGEDTVITCSACDHARNVEFVHPLERTILRLPSSPPNVSIQADASSIESRDFISQDKSTLVRALLPNKDTEGAEIKDVKGLINTHVVKAALAGTVDVATGTEEGAVHKVFFTSSKPREELKQRRLYYLLDKRLNAEHLVSRLQQDNNPDEVELWAVRSSSHDLASPSTIDLLLPRDGDPCPSCKDGRLKVQTAIEVGHTFHLGTRYSAKFGLKKSRVINPSSGQQISDLVEMGCHGIGVSRLIAAAASFHLPNGKEDLWVFRWPKAIAPYHVCILVDRDPGKADGDESLEVSHHIYDALERYGESNDKVDVLLDDRMNLSVGWKIKDALAMGIPILVSCRKERPSERVNVRCPALGVEQTVDSINLPTFVQDLMKRL